MDTPEKKYETIELEVSLDVYDWLKEKAALCDLTVEQLIKAMLVLHPGLRKPCQSE